MKPYTEEGIANDSSLLYYYTNIRVSNWKIVEKLNPALKYFADETSANIFMNSARRTVRQ